jgi:predicted DNA-binding transcriptional regulator YafY
VPIQSEPGRGGGLRTPARAGLGRLQLNTQEMLALAITEQLHSPLLLSTVRGLRQKLAASFPAAERARANQLRQRILVGPTSHNIAFPRGGSRGRQCCNPFKQRSSSGPCCA